MNSMRLAAAHGAGMRFHGDYVEAAAGEDPAVGVVVLLVGDVQAFGVHVEGVGVLHDELADAQQAGFGPGLVAELGLDLIPDLRQLLVAAQFAARDGGHDFFVRHAEAQVAPEAVLEPEHVVAHDVPAAGFLPHFGGIERGQQKSPARRWHPFLRARSAGSSAGSAAPETGNCKCPRRPGGCSRRAAAAGGWHLRFGGVFAQRGDEELAPEHNEGKIQCNNAGDDLYPESNCDRVCGDGAMLALLLAGCRRRKRRNR